ncbi:MAG: ABC transporter ATP-binding protein [Eubacterium sp.]|nr:ABC transporter ATP-binding protein [Eubacterium sp.]
MENIIEVSGVKKEFGSAKTVRTKVLDGASMNVKKGEFVSLMGPSGTGKSTLLYMIGGLDRDYSGDIFVCGKNISKIKEKELSELRLNKIGFIFQFYNLVQNLNVEDNIMLPSLVAGKSKASLKKKLDEILKITGLTEKRKEYPSRLSGGQQQRVAIARAVMGEPELILADEATGNLDKNSGNEIMELFKKINKEKGISILQVTHSEKCAGFGDRIVRLDGGKTE